MAKFIDRVHIAKIGDKKIVTNIREEIKTSQLDKIVDKMPLVFQYIKNNREWIMWALIAIALFKK